MTLMLFIGLAIAVTSNDAHSEENKKRLIVGMSQFPSTLHPGIDSMMAKTYTLGFTRRPLLAYDHDWRKTCMLCTEVPSYDNGRVKMETRADGKQGLSVKYTIHADAKWGDGTPITTKDILFTWNVGKDPKVGITNYVLFSEDIVNIKAIDDKSFTVHTDKVTCDYANLADFDVLPAHVEKAAYEKGGDTYRTETLYDTDTTNAALYNGPYVIADKKTGVSITLARNPHWWGEKPFFDEIVLSTIENTNTLSAQLLTGQIDMIAGELGLPMDQAATLEKRLKKKRDERFAFVYKPGLIYEHIDLNQDSPYFNDKRVRQALLYALNRDVISQQLFDGKQPVAHHSVHPLDKIYVEDIKRYDYNPEAALSLLNEAGWTKGSDGLLKNDKGETLRFTFQTTSGNKSRELVQQAIQENWASIGVQAVIKNEPPRVLFGETLQKRKFDGAIMYAWLSAPENVPKTTLHSTMIPSEKNGYSGQNYVGFNHKEMDKTIDSLEVVCDAEPRNKHWRDLQETYAEELPALPLYFRADVFIYPHGLRGIRPTGHQYPSSLWAENWHRD
jgi:peptide/nickel transport system substrate-binding protein